MVTEVRFSCPLEFKVYTNARLIASKTFAEKAAWKFLEDKKPNFVLATINPPLVFGPVVNYLNSLNALNTSNQRIRNIITGQYKTEIAETGTFLWVDVRDVALAHVKAIEVPAAANKRFFLPAGNFNNREIAQIIAAKFPEYKDQVPGPEVKGGDYPSEGLFKFDNSRARDILGIDFRGLESSIVDTVNSLKAVGA